MDVLDFVCLSPVYTLLESNYLNFFQTNIRSVFMHTNSNFDAVKLYFSFFSKNHAFPKSFCPLSFQCLSCIVPN